MPVIRDGLSGTWVLSATRRLLFLAPDRASHGSCGKGVLLAPLRCRHSGDPGSGDRMRWRAAVRKTGGTPPPRKQLPQRATALDRLHDPITAMLTSEPHLTIRQIWERLLDDHDAEISYARVRGYVIRLRSGIQGPVADRANILP